MPLHALVRSLMALTLAALLGGCVVVPIAISAVVGPIEGRPIVKLNSVRTVQQQQQQAAQATPTPAPTETPIQAL